MPSPSQPLPLPERAAFSMRDAQLYAAMSRNRLCRGIKAGLIKSKMLGNRRIVMRESLDAILKIDD